MSTLDKLKAIRGFLSWRKTDFVYYCEILATYNEPPCHSFYKETESAATQIMLYGTKESIKTFLEWHEWHSDATKQACVSGIMEAFVKYTKKVFNREILFQDWFIELFERISKSERKRGIYFKIKSDDTGLEVCRTIDDICDIMRLHQLILAEEKLRPGGSEYESIKARFIERQNQ